MSASDGGPPGRPAVGSSGRSDISPSAPPAPAADFAVDLVGDSPALASIREVAASIAGRRSTVLLLGETGTGKELLARFIHQHSDRAARPFIAVDCSAITESLFESQLFGHVRGAFTGAVRDSLGFIRASDGGTLFLDEIGELSPTSQAKLLRVIQERTVVPVGETRPRRVNLRVVAATHRNLADMVDAGTFRQDLLFRINVVTIHVPPLRERPTDILPLAKKFLALQADLYDEPIKSLSSEAVDCVQRYSWPGNVRELANAIEHAHVLAHDSTIRPEDLPDRVRLAGRGDRASLPGELCLADLERRAIAEAMRRTNNNKTAAAQLLGIHVQKLRRRIEKLRLRLPTH